MSYRAKIYASLHKKAVNILKGGVELGEDSEDGTPYVRVYLGDQDSEIQIGGGDERKGSLMIQKIENSIEETLKPVIEKFKIDGEEVNRTYKELYRNVQDSRATGDDFSHLAEEIRSLKWPKLGDYISNAVSILKNNDKIKNIMPRVVTDRGSKNAEIDFVYEANDLNDSDLYVNVYESVQEYGGPEEGGWYYNQNYPISSKKVNNYAEAVSLKEKLEVDIKEKNAVRGSGSMKVQDWAKDLPDEWEPNSQQEDESTVYYEGTEFVTIESHPAKQPGARPRYSSRNYRKKIAMNLFNHTIDLDGDKRQDALIAPWQGVDIISSNCPIHTGVRLGKMNDNAYQCPKGKEIYKAKGSIDNQTSKDRYDLGFSIR